MSHECRATQDRQVMVRSSDKTWSTGEGNGKPLQYSCLKNPMNSTKKQKDMPLQLVCCSHGVTKSRTRLSDWTEWNWFPSLPAFPFFTLGPFLAGFFLGLGSGFGGAGLADNLAALLCGSSFTLALSSLASPSAFLLSRVVMVARCRYWTPGCSGTQALVGPRVALACFSNYVFMHLISEL